MAKFSSRARKKETSSRKTKIFMVLALLFGIAYAYDPALLPADIRGNDAVQKFYRNRDRTALYLPEMLRPSSVKTEKGGSPTVPGTGYAAEERQEMNTLIDKGVAQ